MFHIPVLLKEVVEILNPLPGEFFIDGTLGGGGHAIEIIKKISPNGIFLGLDLDGEAIENFKLKTKNLKPKIFIVQGNYANLPKILESLKDGKIEGLNFENKGLKDLKADGLIVDLGFSSDQLEKTGKGFSFLKDEPLIMNYAYKIKNSEFGNENFLTAAQVINSFKEQELVDIFWKYGEERFSRSIVKKIIEERRKKTILTTFGLVDAIKKATPKNYEKNRIHPATRVFQALRIYVNDELGNLENLLKNLEKILKPKGRTAIISFHSLEDRLVKNYFQEKAKKGVLEILTKKPITAKLEEVIENPRSRSAKMRAIMLN